MTKPVDKIQDYVAIGKGFLTHTSDGRNAIEVDRVVIRIHQKENASTELHKPNIDVKVQMYKDDVVVCTQTQEIRLEYGSTYVNIDWSNIEALIPVEIA